MTPDERTIRELDLQWYAAEQRKDLEATMRFIAEDAVYLIPNRVPVEGREAIKRILADGFRTLVAISGQPTLVAVSAGGDLAYAVGHECSVWRRPEGEIETHGTYLVVWKKIDGEWKAVALSVTNDEPID